MNTLRNGYEFRYFITIWQSIGVKQYVLLLTPQLLTPQLLTPQLSKYAMTAAHEVCAAREPIGVAEKRQQ